MGKDTCTSKVVVKRNETHINTGIIGVGGTGSSFKWGESVSKQMSLVSLTPNDYQALAARTVNTDLNKQQLLGEAALGLTGEAGEFANYVKKHLYQGHPMQSEELFEELADICWYIALAATVLGVNLEDVMQANIDKLKVRYPQGFSSVDSLNRVDTIK